MSQIVKVSDARTGKVKRYEDEQGRAVAIMKGGRLVMTSRGAEMNLVIKNNKLHEIGSLHPAY